MWKIRFWRKTVLSWKAFCKHLPATIARSKCCGLIHFTSEPFNLYYPEVVNTYTNEKCWAHLLILAINSFHSGSVLFTQASPVLTTSNSVQLHGSMTQIFSPSETPSETFYYAFISIISFGNFLLADKTISGSDPLYAIIVGAVAAPLLLILSITCCCCFYMGKKKKKRSAH